MASIRAPKDVNLSVDDRRWELVEHILGSRVLQQSPRLREMFRYICERSLHESASEVREIEIGIHVFGRPPDFDPSHDTIVRVQASQLRKKIGRYFEDEGLHETLLLEIAKGNYAPVFRERPPAAALIPAAAPFRTSNPYRMASFVLAAIVLLLLGAVAWLIHGSSTAGVEAALKKEPNLRLLWSQLLNSNQPTKILVADTSLSFLRYLVHQGPLRLSAYLDRSYLNELDKLPPDLRHAATVLAGRQYTGIADVEVTAGIMSLAVGSGAKVSVVYSRDFNLRQFQSANVILLGSRISNPWVELFEQRLNFQIGRDDSGAMAIVNLHPKSGEERAYTNTSTGVPGESYGVVAFLPNLDRTGNVLLVAGFDMEATEAIGQFITAEEFFGPFAAKLPSTPKGRLPYFEGLIRTSKLGGTVKDLKAIAYRVLAF